MVIKKEKILLAQEKIIDLIALQARHGAQSNVVKKINQNYFCLGQFLNANDRKQRGIHGSATGLRVLAESTGNNDLIDGLTRYLEDRPGNERLVQDYEESINEDKLVRDDNNVIKISEILYALHFVKPGISATEAFARKLERKLRSGQINESGETGWDFYIDENPKEIQLLPTAFAMIALEKNGYDISHVKKSLQKRIKETNIIHPSSFAEIILCLYSLINLSQPITKEEMKLYESLLKKIWNSSFCSLENDFEQNLEYWYNTQHDYVRVPWQMYLMAILSKLSKFRFYTLNSQRRINSLIENAISQGFKYHYSGPNLSTRTNAILYDTMSFVNKNLEKNFLHKCLVWFDTLRQFLGSKVVKRIAFIIGICFGTYTIYSWLSSPDTKWSDIAPEFIGSIFLTAIALGKRK